MMIAGFVKHLYISCFLRRPIGNFETNFRRYPENLIFYMKFGGFQDAELVYAMHRFMEALVEGRCEVFEKTKYET